MLTPQSLLAQTAGPQLSEPLLAEYQQQVAGIFAQHCQDCHGGEDPDAALSLTDMQSVLRGSRSGPILQPGSPKQSLFLRLIQAGSQPHMPPEGQLSPEEIAALTGWVQALPAELGPQLKSAPISAEDRQHWSFLPVQDSAAPATQDSEARSPVDAFVFADQQARGLGHQPPADALTQIRRLSLDLVGLAPAKAEVDLFVNDTNPDAYERLTDRLLHSPHYGERFGRHWLDLARYADSNGFEFDVDRPTAYHYRDYVIRSMNTDRPYDRFVQEQIAGDELWPTEVDSLIATGFCRLGPTVANQESEKIRLDELDDVVATTGSVFLGLTIGCARCHDHKYDPIRLEDYYRLLAVFDNMQTADLPLLTPEEKTSVETAARPIQQQIDALHAQIAKLRNQAQPGDWQKEGLELSQSKLVPNVRMFFGDPQWTNYSLELEAKRTGGDEGFLIAFRVQDYQNFYWIHFGGWGNQQHGLEFEKDGSRSIVGQLLPAHLENDRWYRVKIVVAQDRVQAFLNDEKLFDQSGLEFSKGAIGFGSWSTAVRFRHLVVQDLDGKPLRTQLPDPANPDAFGLPANASEKIRDLERELRSLERQLPLVAMAPGVIQSGNQRVTRVLFRGDHRTPGPPVEPGMPAVLSAGAATDNPLRGAAASWSAAHPRSDLAKWLTAADNPLTSRVMVNRLWQNHFGTGLVESASNFGKNGSPVDNLPLLNWLALRFAEHGYSQKTIHRLLVNSAVYRQSSAPQQPWQLADPQNRGLWRYPPHRLDAEIIRDNILQAAGSLDAQMYGPGIHPRIHPSVIATGSTMKWPEINAEGPEHWRRSVYVFVKRSVLLPMLEGFDAPNATQSCARRVTTTVATQALQLLNDQFTNDQAERMAHSVFAQTGANRQAQIDITFWRTLSRAPTPSEVEQAEQFLTAQRTYHLDALPGQEETSKQQAAELLALEDLCQVMFNLNEFVYTP